MTNYQKKQNELALSKIIQTATVWVWPDIMECYDIQDGKLKPKTKNGERAVKKIVSSAFFKENVIGFN
jgi:hypothetical protein